jgi:hypothetical protein
MKALLLAAPLVVGFAFAQAALAGAGCDLNIRINNQSPNAITVYGVAHSSASKAGLNLWSPLTGMEDAVLDPASAGAAAHSKQAVELQLPCWTGKIDFRIRYLDGSVEKWKYRYGVEVKSGDTVQINLP